MAVSFRAASGAQGGSTTASSFSVTQPAGATSGDIAIVAINVGINTSFNTVAGWTLDDNLQNGAATSPFTSGIYYRVLDGTESWPVSFSCGAAGKFAWVCAAFTPGGGNTIRVDSEATPKQDTAAGTSHTANPATAIASSVASVILNMGRRQVSSATGITVTPPANWTEPANGDQTTAVSTGTANAQIGAEVCYRLGQSGTITPGASTYTSAAANVFQILVTDVPPPVTSGPPLAGSLQSPAGLVVSLVRTGVAMASLIPAAAAPPPTPTAGPPFFPVRWPVQAQDPLGQQRVSGIPGPRGRVYGISAGAPVRNPVPPVTGPVFYPARQAIRARLPQPPAGMGALRGRCASSPPAPVRNPSPGPVFRLKPAPVRFVLPPWRPRAGRIGSSFGAPVINPVRGPTFTPLRWPVQAQDLPPRRGRVYSTARLAAPVVPVHAGPQFFPFRQAVRARLPLQPFLRGRSASSPGAPVRNPNVIPVSGAITGPVRAPLPANLRGRTRVAPPAARVTPPPPATGPVFFPFTRAVRAPLPPAGEPNTFGRAAAMVAVPAPPALGPVFRQAPRPARAPVPQTFSKGRTSGSRGAPVRNPSAGPVFRQAVRPAQARRPLPPRGRVASGPGGPVRNPVPGGQGPAFFPFRQAVRIRPSLPPRGRAAGNPGGPVHNPPPPVPAPILPRSQAVRGQVLPASSANFWGRAATMVALPVPVHAGPVFRQATQAKAKIPPFSKGRIGSNPGSIPPPPRPGTSMGQPAGIRVIYLAAGRCQSTPAAPPAPVPPPAAGPVFRQATSPARTRPQLPPRGRTAGSRGGPVRNPVPVTGPVFVPRHDPARIRPSLPPRGRVAANRGAPVRNPSHGPAFIARPWPARTRIPQNAPRGRTASGPGGPVENIPLANPLFRLGIPGSGWDAGSPAFRWAAGIPAGPVLQLAAGSPDLRWETGIPAAQWAAGSPVTSS